MKKLIVILSVLTMSSTVFADGVIKAVAGENSATAIIFQTDGTCQPSENAALLSTIPYMLTEGRPACNTAIEAYYLQNPEAPTNLKFKLVNSFDEEIQARQTAPDGQSCGRRQFIGYLVSHCTLEVDVINK